MAFMVGKTPLLLAAVLALGMTGLPLGAASGREGLTERPPTTATQSATDPAASSGPPDMPSSRAPSGGRAFDWTQRTTSPCELSWATRAISVVSDATITEHLGRSDRPGRAEHDRCPPRWDAAEDRSPSTAAAVPGRVSDQTIIVPLGGILPDGATTRLPRHVFGHPAHQRCAGSNWLFTKANGIVDLYRWLPWVSRAIAFDRPNHGDPFQTPSSRSVRVRIVADRRLVLATTGQRDLGLRRRADAGLRST